MFRIASLATVAFCIGCADCSCLREAESRDIRLVTRFPETLDWNLTPWVRFGWVPAGNYSGVWLFARVNDERFKGFASFRFDGSGWSGPTPCPVLEGSHRSALVPLESGRLALLWDRRHDHGATPKPIRMSLWDGTTWGPDKDTHALVAKTDTGLVAWRSPDGVPRALYLGKLAADNYRVGGHWWDPYKPFCMKFLRGAWREPKPITGPSRWDYRDPFVFVHGGRSHLLAEAGDAGWFLRHLKQLEHRVLLPDETWSAPDRVTDPCGSISEPSGAMDRAGVMHVVYTVWGENPAGRLVSRSRYRTRTASGWTLARNLGVCGRDGRVTADGQGNVFLFWREEGPDREPGTDEYVTPVSYVMGIVDDKRTEPATVTPQRDVRLLPDKEGVWMAGRDQSGQAVVQKVTLVRSRP